MKIHGMKYIAIVTTITITIINMNKIIKFIKKNYIYINVAFLMLAIYIVLFPLISIPIKNVFPQFGECTYLRVTGEPCPLCGGTRYIQNLPSRITDIEYLLQPFGIIIFFIFVEIIFRIINILRIKKEKTNDKLVKIDVTAHLLLLIALSLYEIIFLLN